MLSILAQTLLDEGMPPQEVERVIGTYGTDLLRLAFMYLKDRQKAEDICQEVFIKYYRSAKEFTSDEHEKAWLLRVTVNLCKDQLKSAWSKRAVFDDGVMAATAVAPDNVEKAIENKELLRTVMELPEVFRTVVVLFYYQGLSTQEIAKITQTPEATVRSRLKRAREKLYVVLKGGDRD